MVKNKDFGLGLMVQNTINITRILRLFYLILMSNGISLKIGSNEPEEHLVASPQVKEYYT
jgi:hypothetical protein